MINPYFGQEIAGFSLLFFKRLLMGFPGGIVSDELQIFVMALVAMSSALMGVFLILKRMTMLANALSHTVLLGIVLAYLIFSGSSSLGQLSLTIFIFGALLSALLTTVFTQGLIRRVKLQEDASIGIVFSSFFALGILLVTLFTRNTHLGLEAIMGNVEALHSDDLKRMIALFGSNVLLLLLFFKEFRLCAFDTSYARLIGGKPALFNYLLMIQLAVVATGSFRAVGALLFVAFVVGPPLTARLFTKQLSSWLVLSSSLGALYGFLGTAVSRHSLSKYQLPLSTSALVVTLIGVGYLLSLFLAPKKGFITRYIRQVILRKKATDQIRSEYGDFSRPNYS